MKNLKFLFSSFIILIFSSCLTPPDELESENAVGIVDGIKPIYIPIDQVQNYEQEGPQPIINLGKIYYKKPYIFVNESGRGIHIVDNTDVTDPQKIGFLNIAGNNDIAIKNNMLYADNRSDLVVFDISNINEIKFVNRVENVYSNLEKIFFPPGYTGWFECVDEGEGWLVGWEETILENPTCNR